jgi:hypothetical protein
MAVTECQGCGAWNHTSRTLCVLCGTPLAETDEWDAAAELPPLPPLPDGGLRASMPTWLREPPGAAPVPVTPPGNAPPILASTTNATATASSLGPRADPRTFLTDDDFPRWLRDLAARRAVVQQPPAEMASLPPRPAPSPTAPAPLSGRQSAIAPATSIAMSAEPDPPPVMPPTPAHTPVPVVPEQAPITDAAPSPAPARLLPAEVAARAPEERRGRQPWETFLLVALVIGVVVAALWALVANGVLGPGP